MACKFDMDKNNFQSIFRLYNCLLVKSTNLFGKLIEIKSNFDIFSVIKIVCRETHRNVNFAHLVT